MKENKGIKLCVIALAFLIVLSMLASSAMAVTRQDLCTKFLAQKEIEDLKNNTKNKFKYSIRNNCIPQIDVFLENDYTKEEMKMIEETRKILGIKDLNITATCVRVPVLNCHGESINVEFEEEFDIQELKQNLCREEMIVLLDDPKKEIYPLQTFVDGKDEVFVGRIRRDYSVKSGINMWCVADNIRKGAATNAVQILEKLIGKRLGK